MYNHSLTKVLSHTCTALYTLHARDNSLRQREWCICPSASIVLGTRDATCWSRCWRRWDILSPDRPAGTCSSNVIQLHVSCCIDLVDSPNIIHTLPTSKRVERTLLPATHTRTSDRAPAPASGCCCHTSDMCRGRRGRACATPSPRRCRRPSSGTARRDSSSDTAGSQHAPSATELDVIFTAHM